MILNELALFTGAAGGILGSILLGHRVVCAVEIDPYCREVLLRRQDDKILPPFPIWDDIRSFDGRPWRGIVDIVSAGFPCQPFSVAGRRAGETDDRNLWPDTIRVIREVRPEWCLLENVSGLLSCPYIRRIFGDLAASGYDCRWDCISAASVGAPHERDRLWIVAYAQEHGRDTWRAGNAKKEASRGKLDRGGVSKDVAHTDCQSSEHSSKPRKECITWPPEPGVGRVAHGVAYRVDRLKALGNGQVPRVVRRAWRKLS